MNAAVSNARAQGGRMMGASSATCRVDVNLDAWRNRCQRVASQAGASELVCARVSSDTRSAAPTPAHRSQRPATKRDGERASCVSVSDAGPSSGSDSAAHMSTRPCLAYTRYASMSAKIPPKAPGTVHGADGSLMDRMDACRCRCRLWLRCGLGIWRCVCDSLSKPATAP